MKTLSVAATLMLAVFLGSSLPVIAAEPMPGSIRVVKVKGDVTCIETSTKKAEPLKEGAFITQDHSVKTGAGSTAILLFSNGTTISLSPNSLFGVDSFRQVPFDPEGVDYSKIKEEPSVSNTKVSLSEGRALAVVAKLAKGSTMDITTPSGVAGIRGTVLSITPTSISVQSGSVQMTSANGNSAMVNGGESATFAGVEAGGPAATPAAMPPAEQAALANEAQQAVEAVAASVPGPGAAFQGAPEGTAEADGANTDAAGGFGGDQGAGSVGTAPTGGTGGGSGGGGGSGTTPSPNNGASNPAP